MKNLTGEQLKTIFKENPKTVAKALTATLVDFGYAITEGYVKTEIERLLAGGQPKGGPSMFIAGWLKDGLD